MSGGGGSESSSAESVPETKADAKPWDASLGTATIAGSVKFVGDAPRRRQIDMGGKAECANLHSEPVLAQDIIVNDNGTLRNVLVYVRKGVEDWKFEPPSDPVVLNQQGCMFEPHVLGVQLGQELIIRNSDPFAHNVNAKAVRNQAFNFTQPSAGVEDTKTFNRGEVFIPVNCDIHGWMSTYIAVIPHPYFAVTDADGSFQLTQLPPGDYTIEAHHEFLDKQTMEVTIGDNETKEVEFSFEDQ